MCSGDFCVIHLGYSSNSFLKFVHISKLPKTSLRRRVFKSALGSAVTFTSCRNTALLIKCKKKEYPGKSEWDFRFTKSELKQINAFKLMVGKTPVTSVEVDVHESV